MSKKSTTEVIETVATVPTLLSPRQAADYLARSERWLEQDRWRGPTIPYIKIGRAVRYRAEDIAAYIERNVIEPSETGRAA